MARVSRLSLEPEGVQSRRRLHLKDVPDDMTPQHDTLGADLRAARLRLGEDLGSVSVALRIRKEHLEAIETSNYGALPGTTYAIGFVRAYADFLGLDPNDAVKRFKKEIGARVEAQPLTFPEAQDEARLGYWSLFGLAALLCVAIWFGTYFMNADPRGATTAVPEVPERLQAAVPPAAVATPPGPPPSIIAPPQPRAPWEPAAAEVAPPAGGTGAAEPEIGGEDDADAPPAPPPIDGPVDAASAADAGVATPTGQVYGAQNADSRITIVALADTWLRIEDQTGKVFINRSIKTGDSYKAPNRPGLILMARDAGSLDLMVDGQKVGVAGPSGMVLTGMPLNPRFLLTRGQPSQ